MVILLRAIQWTTYSFWAAIEDMVKVQTSIPVEWKEELEVMAFELDVGKTELYRIIPGKFLGKSG